MIKKINYLLIIIASLGGVYFALTKDKNVTYILKDLSIIITINGLYILEKLLKTKINENIKFIYVVFIFMAHFLGVIINLYDKIYWYDKLVHFISGIVSGFTTVYILEINKYNKNLLFNVLFILSFSMLIASLWEIFEYISSLLFNVDPQKVATTGVSDTIGDIIVALLGSILVSISYYFEHKHNCNLLVKRFEKLI